MRYNTSPKTITYNSRRQNFSATPDARKSRYSISNSTPIFQGIYKVSIYLLLFLGLNISIPQPLGASGFPPSAGGISIAGSPQVSATPMSLGLTPQSISQLSPIPNAQTSMTISPQSQNLSTLQFTPLHLGANHTPSSISLPSSPLPYKPSPVPQMLNNSPHPTLNLSQFSPVSVTLTQPSSSGSSILTSHSTIGLAQNFQGSLGSTETPVNIAPESTTMVPTSLAPRLSGSLTITPTGGTGIPVLLTPR